MNYYNVSKNNHMYGNKKNLLLCQKCNIKVNKDRNY